MLQLKNLQKEAAKFGYFDAASIPAQYLKRQTLNNEFSIDYSELVSSSKPEYPDELLKGYTSGLFFKCYEQKNSFSGNTELFVVDRPTMFFLTPAGRIVLLSSYKGKYDFFLLWDYRQKLTTNYTEQAKAIKAAGLVEPNKIGVFTRKKIDTWLEYCDKVYNAIHEQNSETDKKNAEIRAEIMEFIKNTRGNFSEHSGNIYADCGPFCITFEHDRQSASLYTKIQYKGTLEQIEQLLKK